MNEHSPNRNVRIIYFIQIMRNWNKKILLPMRTVMLLYSTQVNGRYCLFLSTYDCPIFYRSFVYNYHVFMILLIMSNNLLYFWSDMFSIDIIFYIYICICIQIFIISNNQTITRFNGLNSNFQNKIATVLRLGTWCLISSRKRLSLGSSLFT